ncbi:hypothetical protein MMC10_000915 [Thelotrema lepadinum]|nr:hypothetical protein [Thelotrema lepadinum]
MPLARGVSPGGMNIGDPKLAMEELLDFLLDKNSLLDTNFPLDSKARPLHPALPVKAQHPMLRNLRHRFLAVYQRLFSVVFLANLAAFIPLIVLRTSPTLVSIATIATPIAVNLFVAGLFRTEYMINLLYASVLWVPISIPLAVRRRLAKVYEFGGVHSGSGVACTLWALLFLVQITRGFVQGEPIGIAAVAVTYCLVLLLTVIVIAAHPAIRRKYHNYFEALHRICGWVALLLYWALAILLSQDISSTTGSSLAQVLFTSPVIYFLVGTTILTILPWLHLRSVDATATPLSAHATRIYFPSPYVGPAQGIRISTSPLLEWHSFASIPCRSFANKSEIAKASSCSILVSSAGDWTKKSIADSQLHRKYWMRGIPVTGVALVVRLFRSAVIITTGSGIGPALSLIAAARAPDVEEGRKVSCRLFWSTPNPLQTYGQNVIDEVRAADPEAIIWDTKTQGRPDMVQETWNAYSKFGAEAVLIISNPKVTAQVVYGMESRGVPAYGPIFDS